MILKSQHDFSPRPARLHVAVGGLDLGKWIVLYGQFRFARLQIAE